MEPPLLIIVYRRTDRRIVLKKTNKKVKVCIELSTDDMRPIHFMLNVDLELFTCSYYG